MSFEPIFRILIQGDEYGEKEAQSEKAETD